MKFPTSTSLTAAQPWFTTHENPKSDPRLSSNALDGDSYINREDKGWRINVRTESEGNVRMDIFSVPKTELNKKISDDKNTRKSRHYMHSKSDWKNVEMTAYVMGDFRSFACCIRGADTMTENNSNVYKAYVFQQDRKILFVKEPLEQLHERGEELDSEGVIGEAEQIGEILPDKWFGIKLVIYNSQEEKVKLELRVDRSPKGWDALDNKLGQNEEEWKLVKEVIDTKEPITWGGPIASFRWFRSDWVWFKSASVREIEIT